VHNGTGIYKAWKLNFDLRKIYKSLPLIFYQIKHMKYIQFTALFLLTAMLSSCEAIAAIFKTGVWTGVILVVVILGGIIYLFSRRTKK